MKRFITTILVLAATFVWTTGAQTEEDLLSAWNISPSLYGYEIAPIIKEHFNLDLVKSDDGPHHIAGEIKLSMFGYTADIETYWFGKGYTIVFDDLTTKNSGEYGSLSENAANRYDDILAGFTEKYGEPDQVAIDYYGALGIKGINEEVFPYDDSFDIRNHLVFNEDVDRICVRIVKNNVVLSLDHRYELSFAEDKNGIWSLSSSFNIKFYPERVDLPKPRPSVAPTPVPTNIPTGF